MTRRDFAGQIGLKLNKVKHLKLQKGRTICVDCRKDIPGKFYFAEFYWRDLQTPVDCGYFVMKSYPVVYSKYCIPCAIARFSDCFRKDGNLISIREQYGFKI